MKFLLLIIPFFSVFSFSNDCPGYVNDIETDLGNTFTGMCDSSNQLLWGVTKYKSGEYYAGYYEDGIRETGTYYWPNGANMTGTNIEPSMEQDGFEVDFVGIYTFDDGSQHSGYFRGTIPSGFGLSNYLNEDRSFEAGIFNSKNDQFGLDGYGVRVVDDYWYWGFWQSGGIIGNYYRTLEADGDPTKFIKSSNGNFDGPYNLNSGDNDRFDTIVSYIQKRLSQFEEYEEYIDSRIDEYNNKEEKQNSFANEGNTESKSEGSYDQDLIKSIQELLAELGYSPGKIDGLLGDKTVAAIKAFEFELELDNLTGKPSEEILIALQVAIRAKNMQTPVNPNQNTEPEIIATGTGFYINNSNIVSNYHVVEGCEYVTDINDNKLKIMVSDEVNDVSLLDGPKTNSYLPISEDSPKLGEKIYVSGFPYNSDLKSFMFSSGNVSSLSGLGKNFSEFSHTAPSQPGNSGGPILNAYGSVIGVLVSGIRASALLEVNDDTGGVTGSIPQNINFGVQNVVLKSLLIDNDIDATFRSDSFFTKSEKSIAEISKRSSVLLKCYGYYEN